MDRRTFLAGTGAVFLAAPLTAEAQQAGKVWRVGVLVVANPRVYDPFVAELRKLGYVEGQNLALEFRSAEGDVERLPALAVELVRAGVDVILAAGPEASLRAARQATTTVPVVIVAIDFDPLARGHVASLARPIELLKTALSKLTRVAILWDRFAADQLKAADAASRSLGIRTQPLELRGPSYDVGGAFAMAAKEHAGAVVVMNSAVLFRERAQIAQLAVKHRLPTMSALREYAEAGGLMSYGTNLPDMVRRAATYVDKILKGAKPGDLPMEQPTRFELVINLTTAKALGLTIPQSLLQRADEIIQ
jgi:putative ABC transport system substrate-binding protein